MGREYDEFLVAFNSLQAPSDNEQGEEYSNIKESDESFEMLSEDVSNAMKKMKEMGFALENHPIIEKLDQLCSGQKSPEPIKQEAPSNIDFPSIQVEITEVVDESLTDDGKNVVDTNEEEEEEVENDDDENPEEGDQSEEVNEPQVGVDPGLSTLDDHRHDIGEHEDYVTVKSYGKYTLKIKYEKEIPWNFDSPAAMWNGLYEKKKHIISRCLVKGELDFDAIEEELGAATVNIHSESFDKNEVLNQMQSVQKWRERIKLIVIRVNTQYFLFKRFYPALESYLANIHYIKPQVKQGGLVLDHLGDVGLYMARLESLHDSVKSTEDTLKACYDTLSRKITVCMELKSRELYEQQESQVVRSLSDLFTTINKGLSKPMMTTESTVIPKSLPSAENKPKNEDKIKSNNEEFQLDMQYDIVPEGASIKRKKIISGESVNWNSL
jgi:hypothetical protein